MAEQVQEQEQELLRMAELLRGARDEVEVRGGGGAGGHGGRGPGAVRDACGTCGTRP
jgi:hypothetical protein